MGKFGSIFGKFGSIFGKIGSIFGKFGSNFGDFLTVFGNFRTIFVSPFLFDVTVATTSERVFVHANSGHASKMDQLKIRTLLAVF